MMEELFIGRKKKLDLLIEKQNREKSPTRSTGLGTASVSGLWLMKSIGHFQKVSSMLYEMYYLEIIDIN